MAEGCEDCRKWKQHYYWTHFSERRLHFFKVMMGDFSRQLMIPPKFTKHINDETSTIAFLKSPNSSIWPVGLKRTDGGVFFENGWHEFVEHHSLKQGDFLVFRYDEKLCFNVQIFDSSACERDDLYLVKDRKKNDCNKRHRVEEKEREDSLRSLGVPKTHETRNCTLSSKHRRKKPRASQQPPACERDDLCSVKDCEKADCNKGHQAEEKEREDSVISLGVPKTHEISNCTLSRKRRRKSTPASQQPPACERDDLCSVKDHAKTDCDKGHQVEEKEREDSAISLGVPKTHETSNCTLSRKRRRKNPLASQQPSACERDDLCSVKDRAKTDCDKGNQVEEKEREDSAILLGVPKTHETSNCTLSRKRRRKNPLASQQPCSRVSVQSDGREEQCLTRETKSIFFKERNANGVITISSESPSSESSADQCNQFSEAVENSHKLKESVGFSVGEANSSLRGRAATKRYLKIAEKTGAYQAACALKTDNPYFIAVMQKSAVSGGFYMRIPSNFAKEYLPGKSSWITLRDSTGKTWPVNFLVRREWGHLLSGGWTRFSRDNHFVIGDVCVFELIKSNSKIVLHTYTFRAGNASNGAQG